MPHKSPGSGAKTQGARCHPKGAADTGFASQIIFRRQDFGQARLGWGYVGHPGWGEGEGVEGGRLADGVHVVSRGEEVMTDS